ncbi:hypothetical protein pkur_cds_59 [Pandoravirus kuranda]|uniref:DUF5848 domain-containing protein n=1 Tax=Pandoravirus kuranda TaxID=3019033 RepID=A0AA95J1X5_9VIRU|nr:hypothetical protein pkur_cds_59 [Pandoravirus kuranda]
MSGNGDTSNNNNIDTNNHNNNNSDGSNDNNDARNGASDRPTLPVRSLIRSVLIACRRLARRRTMPPAQHRFVAVLLSRARFRMPDEAADDATIERLSRDMAATYVWFWRALRAVERAAPAISDVLLPFPTPRSVLAAARAEERPTDTGMAMARRAVHALVAMCRARGLMPADEPRWSPWAERPYALVLYPRARSGRTAILVRGESIVLSMHFAGRCVRPAHVRIARPHLLPVSLVGAAHAQIAIGYADLVDRAAAAVAATLTRADSPALSHCALPATRALPPLPPLMRAGMFDMPAVAVGPLFHGDYPDALVAVMRFDDVQLAAWLRARPFRGSCHLGARAAYASDDETESDM